MKPTHLLLQVSVLLLITSCGNQGSVDLAPDEPENLPPAIQAMSDKDVNEGAEVIIKVEAADDHTTELQYAWQQQSGISVDLQTADQAEIGFIAPHISLVDDSTQLVFSVEVSDELGAKSSKQVIVNVAALAIPPVIESSNYTSELFSNQTAAIDCTVTDSDGEVIALELSQIEGSAVELISQNQCPIAFKVPAVESLQEIKLQLTAKDDEDLLTHQIYSFSISPTRLLNDTGVTTCIDYAQETSGNSNSGLDCSLQSDSEGDPILYGQDGHYGRDGKPQNNLKTVQSGRHQVDASNGFSYSKVGIDGSILADDATDWSCIRDNVTGLLWQNKTNDDGLHDKDNTFSWYEPDENKNAGDPGLENGGVCVSESCDTYHYVIDVNKQGYCGISSWRLPKPMELFSIADLSREDPALDTSYFQNAEGGYFYWSSIPVVPTEFFYGFAKGLDSRVGVLAAFPSSRAYAIMLVSNEQN